jgi:hypothetical protein
MLSQRPVTQRGALNASPNEATAAEDDGWTRHRAGHPPARELAEAVTGSAANRQNALSE